MTIEQGTNGQVCAIPTLVTADDLNAYYKSEQAQIWAPVAVDGWGDGLPVYTPTPDPEQIIQSTRDIAQQTSEGLLPALGVSQDKLKHWIIQYQQERAAVWVRKILMKDNTLFTQNDSGAYQLSEWFAKQYKNITAQDANSFLLALEKTHAALRKAVEMKTSKDDDSCFNIVLAHESGQAAAHCSKKAVASLAFAPVPRPGPCVSFQNVHSQQDAIILADILLALQDWRKEQKRQGGSSMPSTLPHPYALLRDL